MIDKNFGFIKLYLQNQEVGITKETYLEICNQMGNKPIVEETPVELSDFIEDFQICFTICDVMPDKWDGIQDDELRFR